MTTLLRPGDQAPAEGIYRVTHYRHRMPHAVSVLGGTVLPLCQKCGDHVRFEFIGSHRDERELHGDADFTVSGN